MNVSIAYYIARYAWDDIYSVSSYEYLVQFTNLIIGICNSERPDPHFIPKEVCYHRYQELFESNVADFVQLRDFENISLFRNLVQEVFDQEFPYPKKLRKEVKIFLERFYRYCDWKEFL